MNYESPEEALNSLMGHTLIEWGTDANETHHITLDDGRILVFIGLGIYVDRTDVVH